MPDFKIIKNVLCITFDSLNRIGNYSIVIKGNRIFDIEYNNTYTDNDVLKKKYPNATIYNGENKILLPSFFNACKNSSYILSSVFFKDIKYDDINTNIPLRLTDNYFLKKENSEDLFKLFKLSYFLSLLNGESFVNENSKYLNADLILSDSLSSIKIKPDTIFTVYDNYISDYILGINRFHCIGLKEDEDLNNYSIGSIKSALSRGNKRAIIEVYQSANSSDTLRNLFGKSFIKVLLENDLLTGKVIFSNPVYLSTEELAIISERNINILIQPTDWIRLSRKVNELEKFFSFKNNLYILIGTGILGKSVFSQIKLLYQIIPRNLLTAETLLKLITVKPASFFNISNIYGSIEKNKLANFVLFDLSDVRSLLSIPEVNCELLSEFILENLEEKNISDIFFHGVPVLENYQSNLIKFEEVYQLHLELLKKIYEIGKYFDLKEKILMKERVNDLSLQNKPFKESVVNINVPENVSQYDSETQESEFRIIGAFKSDIFSTEDEKEHENEPLIHNIALSVKEISNLNSGFDFLDFLGEEYYVSQSFKPEKEKESKTISDKKLKIKKKIYFDDTEHSQDDENVGKLKSTKNSILSYFIKSKSKEGKVRFKKDKLRFGFDDE